MDGMVAQSFYAEEKGNCSFELRCQEQYLEVEEGLLVYREVGFIWRRGEKVDLEGVRLLVVSILGRSFACLQDLLGRRKVLV